MFEKNKKYLYKIISLCIIILLLILVVFKKGEFMDDLDIFDAIELIIAFTLAILMAGGFSA